jgi:hypothetical protein
VDRASPLWVNNNFNNEKQNFKTYIFYSSGLKGLFLGGNRAPSSLESRKPMRTFMQGQGE